MGGIGGPELFVIFLVVLLVFGPKKIPEVARGVGKGLREIRKLTTEFQREINLSDTDDDRRRIGGDAPRAPGPAGAGPPESSAAAPPADEAPDGTPPEGDRGAKPDGGATG
ncbi:MAG TPA: twin-arginine translocase TatA/TatE family subunit [bacterium]|nr:twin-arginine translocase TatA/TatE family subunit [bacterium]